MQTKPLLLFFYQLSSFFKFIHINWYKSRFRYRKSNTEFRSEVTKILSRHETSFDTLTNNYNQLNSILQTKGSPCSGIVPLTWDEFTQAVLQRSGLTDFENPSEALTRLKQTTTVTTYHKTFEKLFHRVDCLPKKFLVGCFIAGLRDEIRLNVKIKQPSTLADTIEVARLIEERNQLQKTPSQPFRSQQTLVTPKANSNPTASLLGPSPNTTPTTFQRITNQEARARREKSLCYYCDEKYVPRHHCQRPQFFMI
ncbi:hypothetical protein ACOSQ4_011956 [Xanthoceras sorbifolium]